MREIKFRAWHIKRKKYYYNIERVLIEKQNGGMQENNFGAWLEMEKQGKVVIEPYTNINDKNGNKIYNGDVLRIGVKGLLIYEVIWYLDGFSIKNDKESLHKNLRHFNPNIVEIIGNIHENGDLLK